MKLGHVRSDLTHSHADECAYIPRQMWKFLLTQQLMIKAAYSAQTRLHSKLQGTGVTAPSDARNVVTFNDDDNVDDDQCRPGVCWLSCNCKLAVRL